MGYQRSACAWIALLLLTCCAPSGQLDEDRLIGTWQALPEENGQTGEFVLHFERASDGGLMTSLSMPAIDVERLEIGAAELGEGAVHIGASIYRWDAEDETLSGSLPASLVPVHDIAVTFRRLATWPAPAPATLDTPPMEPLWRFESGAAIWAAPLFLDDRVYVGNDSGSFFAIEASAGTLVWRFDAGGAIRARASADGEALLVPADDGMLYRISRARGVELQRFPVGATGPVHRDPQAYDHFASSAVLAEGALYIGGVGGLYRLDAQTGAEQWSFSVDGPIRGTPLVHDGRVFFGSFDHHVYAVDMRSGQLLWKRDTGAPVVSAPALFDGNVVIGSRSYDLFALSAETGETEWRYYYWFSWVESSAALGDGTAYIGSSDSQKLNAIDAATGELLWAFDTGGSPWAMPAMSSDTVFVGAVGVADYIVDHRGGFFAVDRSTGEPWGAFSVPRPGDASQWGFASAPAVGVSRVFVGGLDGNLYAFPSSSRPAK